MVLTKRLHLLMERYQKGKFGFWRNALYYAAGAALGYNLMFALGERLSFK